jgi:signal transduction histidine kinase
MKFFSDQPRQRQPRFLWQGMLIVLPVAVLAVVSLASLHRDEQAAERNARTRAAENVQSLARTVRSTVNDELHQFLTLQNVWMMCVNSASQPGVAGVFPDDKLNADIAKWERNYPGFKLSELASSEGSLLKDGRQIKPPGIPAVPVPPKWFLELSQEQRELWSSLRRSETLDDSAEVQSIFKAFLDSKPSEDATAVATYLLRKPEEILGGGHQPFLTESGISLQDLACYRLLRSDGLLPESLLNAVWHQLFENPSFVAPSLLELAEARTNNADAIVQEKVYWMRQLWESQSRTRGWLNPLRTLRHPPLNAARWTKNDSGEEALGFFQPTTFNMGSDSEGVPLSGRGYGIWFFPRAVVEAIFTRALAENKFLIPEYATLEVTVEGTPLRLTSGSASSDAKSLLGSATQKFGTTYSFPDAATFELKFYLTSREQMLSNERRRAKLFGALIIGTALTALVGLLAAWRAFLRQRQLNEMKSNFVSSVSHELRAPIASMRLMAENLERGKVQEPPRQKEYFSFIVQECRRLSSLIENILDFSRIEQGRKQYEFEPTNMVALTEQTMKLMEHGAADKDVRLELETRNIEHRTSNIQHPMPDAGELRAGIELNVDGKAMQQALVNLIDNAIKHSPKGSMVQIGLKLDSASFQLWVADAGEGIPSGEHEKIFERFYRRGSELRRETQGVGIGLSIVKHIVEAHGGRVLVASEVGKGSRFTIEIPVNNEK